jgi:hypothetical protein
MQLHEVERFLRFSELDFFVTPHKRGGFLVNVSVPDRGDFETLRTEGGAVRVFQTLDSVYSLLMGLGVESFEVSK